MIKKQGLYDPAFEHDACGVGFVVNVDGKKNHEIVENGITILKNLEHRGAVAGDAKTGDGAGMLLQIPHKFFAKECIKEGFEIGNVGEYGVGMMFFPNDSVKYDIAVQIAEKNIVDNGGKVIGWRKVPVHPECLGDIAKKTLPAVAQVFVAFDGLSGDALERKMYVTRKTIETAGAKHGFSIEEYYVSSFSSRTITYKGLFVASQFATFYPDLESEDFESALALVHQRYSTNTFPSWPLAQPFRFVAHNGEINTLRGNINKMKAREATMSSPLFGEDISKLSPVVDSNLSDSANFDNVFELLFLGGREIEHTAMMMIPEAFGAKYHISSDKRSFYEYHAAVMEPWDGPAAMAFTDGEKIGATLDRNGLRPARYIVTKSGKVVMASEVGVLDIDPSDVLHKGRLAPGKMFIVDTKLGRVVSDNEIKSAVSRKKPYRRWLEKNRIELSGLFQSPTTFDFDEDAYVLNQKIFGYTIEDSKDIIAPMAENAQEPIGSMGNDAPLAVLSERPQLLYSYFKQLFAQVTNPPIDPYRENLVMSLMSFVGKEGNLLEENPEHCHQLKLKHPVLTNDDMDNLRDVDIDGLRACTIPILFDANGKENTLEKAIDQLCKDVEYNVDKGYSLIVLSDRGVDEDNAPIPALLAVSAVHQYLVSVKKRQLTGLIIETAEARDVMHFATLIGFGASAINPYMAFEIIAGMKSMGTLPADLKYETAYDNYITAIKKGLLKIMSKIGVSTIRSYRGAQIFEAVGLKRSFIDKYFPNTPSRIGGLDINDIQKELLLRHKSAFKNDTSLPNPVNYGGDLHYRDSSERHRLAPEVIVQIQKAVREGNYDAYRKYATLVNEDNKKTCTLRGLFSFKKRTSIPIDEVEPVENIVKRFVTSAMSFGSLSKEVHETMAIAMNRLGAASNSGEGGEDEARYVPMPNGDSKKSAVKQIASGRFGVTSHYLVNSQELQIKMAQGAKPGEGGQLPGHKVNEVIAKVRSSTPGVMLISPPPHHDIYSIEDLAQLIFDLKNANKDARVSVKLVSEVGVGTVAAGVVKGKADMVLISGHDGGTGASPISSIKHAGVPWEIGLSETQQTLVLNHLRDRVRVQVDGQLRTGRDVVIGALLGAEEFGFGTISLVTLGCVMMRKCHLNTCPVGIATQNPELRKRFSGKPEHIVNFMRFVAQDTREIMAELGFRTIDEMVGHVEVLETNQALSHWKAHGLDFSAVLKEVESPDGSAVYCTKSQNHDFSLSIDGDIIEKTAKAIKGEGTASIVMPIKNCNRTVGASLSAEISKINGSKGLPDDTIKCKFKGSAGQSFGAFLAKGVTFELEGDTNDYLGKGLSGGKIIVYPPKESTFRSQNNIITGNVNLFGATGGEVYINGMGGERFAVRNSGAIAVVEGVGDHGCEYMTGGRVIVLGETGINFAAGMSGGIAYVLDENQLFDTKCNLEMVDIEPVVDDEDKGFLNTYIQRHVKYTKSEYAARIIKDWIEMLPMFVKVMPIDYRKAMKRIQEDAIKDTESVAMTEEVYK